MNKKIYKGYELAQAVDNGILNLEQKVKSADNMTYFDCTIEFVLNDVAKNIIFENFKLIEDNTEDIEELEIDANGFIHTAKGAWKGRKMDIVFAESLNQLARAVKQLDKKTINLQSNKETQ